MMSPLHERTAHLSVPVQGHRLTDGYYERLAHALRNSGIAIGNPEVLTAPPPDLSRSHSPGAIEATNMASLRRAEFLIADVSRPSIGVGLEIAAAREAGIPVICLCRADAADDLTRMITGIRDRPPMISFFDTLDDVPAILTFALEALGGRREEDPAPVADVTSHFDRLAKDYEHTAQWCHAPQVLDWFRSSGARRGNLLDLGSGTGLVREAATGNGTSLSVGVDASTPMLRHRRSEGARVAGNIEHLPFREGAFSVVTARQVLHYVDDVLTVREASRVMRKDGRFLVAQVAAMDDVVSIWWREIKRGVQPLRRRFYGVADLRHLLSASFHIDDLQVVTVTREQSWGDFLRHVPPARHSVVEAVVRRCPKSIAARIALRVGRDGLQYEQAWCLVRAVHR